MFIECDGCGREYEYIRGSKKGHTLNRCNSCVVNCRITTIAKKALDYLGGKCQNCGYNKCSRSLSFHHRKPEEKSFTISSNYCRKWEVIQVELDKCDILCMNCHNELHYKQDKTKRSQKWKPREAPKYVKKICPNCNEKFNCNRPKSIYCSDKCSRDGRYGIKIRPSKEELEKLLLEMPQNHIARIYKVSESTIRKWMKKFNLTKPKK